MLLIIFRIDDGRYALRLETVERVVRAAAVTPVPGAPEEMLGLLDVAGQPIPVINLRARLHLPGRALDLSDQFVLVRDGPRLLALWIDATEGVVDLPAAQLSRPPELIGGGPGLEGVARLPGGLVLVESLAGVAPTPAAGG